MVCGAILLIAVCRALGCSTSQLLRGREGRPPRPTKSTGGVSKGARRVRANGEKSFYEGEKGAERARARNAPSVHHQRPRAYLKKDASRAALPHHKVSGKKEELVDRVIRHSPASRAASTMYRPESRRCHPFFHHHVGSTNTPNKYSTLPFLAAKCAMPATHRPSIIKASRLSMRLALLFLITAVLPALARVSRGLHSSASQRGEPKGLEDLSWWPDDRSHGSINRAFVRGKKEKQAPRPATSRTSPVNMVGLLDSRA